MTPIEAVTLEVPDPTAAVAKDAGVSPDGSRAQRIVIGSDAGPFADPDGVAWEGAPV
jgi:hypothetical protein